LRKKEKKKKEKKKKEKKKKMVKKKNFLTHEELFPVSSKVTGYEWRQVFVKVQIRAIE
jgi:hypothetical protein